MMKDEPAFPLAKSNSYWNEGMSLRDWFAGQALAGFTSIAFDDGDPIMGAADTAKAAYNYADAMLAERMKS